MPRARPDNLYLKFRLRVLWRMPKSVALSKLKSAIRTGYCPAGIEINYLDWKNTSARGRVREGTIDEDVLMEMRKFYAATRVADSTFRVEKVES